MQYAKRMCHATLSSVACLALPYIAHYHTNGTIFRKRKKLPNIKCVFIFYTYLGWKISHYEKNSAKYYHKCTNVFTYSNHYSYLISIKFSFYGNTSEKYSNIKFHDNPSSRRFVCSTRMQNKRDMSQLTVFFFRNFTNVPRKKFWACLKAHFPAT